MSVTAPIEQTVISDVDLNLNELLGIPGGDSIISGNKPNIFSKENSFVPDITDTEIDDSQVSLVDPIIPDPISELDNLALENPESGKTKQFKSKADLITFTNKLIEKKLLVPFDDDKKLEDYTVADFEELYEVNAHEKEKKIREEIPVQFFQSLPEELQYAAKYVADGGKDLKGLFQALAQSQQVAQLDATTKEGSEAIVRSYLLATNYGTSDEIDEEVDAMKDRNELEKKASKFKPKLDSMQNQIIASKLEREENLRKQREAQATTYTDNVFKVLETGNLNGLKLDRKTQNTLFSGLVQPNYPSVTGKSTNLLGHLLEKYQFVEPNHGLVAEALWLLADPDGYRTKVRENAKKEVVASTVRSLKTEQSLKTSSSGLEEDEVKRTPGQTIKKPSNFFQR
jgi:hypothetical protein